MKFDKYERMGDYHWTTGDRPYKAHALKVAEWITENRILDVGAGDGYITHLLIEAGKDVQGVDNNEKGVELAHNHGMPVQLGSVYNLPFDEQFDAVYFGDTIEHLEFPEQAITELARLTTVIYIATPPKADHLSGYHYQEYTEEGLTNFMKSLGWRLTRTETEHVRIFSRFEKEDGRKRQHNPRPQGESSS
jgi:2-polyprenyl-3-methyl-5-hydroxy-6-metoxy-1,4-benzoquinol methylase